MTVLAMRSTFPETLDDDDTDLAVYQRCLTELDRINRLTFAHQPTLRWLNAATCGLPAGAWISVCDVAFGYGDLLRAIARWADARGLRAQLYGIDLNPRSAAAARAATPPDMPIRYLTGDVFNHRPDAPYDFVVSSQFTHHLSDDQVVRFLRWIDTYAELGWHITDLHRSVLPYYGFPVLARLLGLHSITRTDGAISIARSFRRGEWQAFANIAGVKAEITRAPGFRLCVRSS